MALEIVGSNPTVHPCAYSSADKSTGLRNRGSWVRIPLGALQPTRPWGEENLPTIQEPCNPKPEGEIGRARQNTAAHCIERLIPVVSLLALSAAQAGCAIPQSLEPLPPPVISFADPTSEVSESSQLITKHFTWSYWPCGDYEWTWEIQIPQTLYDYYKAKPRPPTKDYSVYVTDQKDTLYTAKLASKLEEEARRAHLDECDTIHFAASFVQQLAYTSDVETTGSDEYPRYPIETLVDEGGDCEDTSILLAKIMHIMGYDIVLVDLTTHIATGVLESHGFCGTYYTHNGKRYFYLETTGEAGRIGVVPDEYRSQPAYIYDIAPMPVITHTWEATAKEREYRLTITVENVGTAALNDNYVLAGFDAGHSRIWNSVRSGVFDLKGGQPVTVAMYLDVPAGRHTRLVIHVVHEGHSVDTSSSGWFNT